MIIFYKELKLSKHLIDLMFPFDKNSFFIFLQKVEYNLGLNLIVISSSSVDICLYSILTMSVYLSAKDFSSLRFILFLISYLKSDPFTKTWARR